MSEEYRNRLIAYRVAMSTFQSMLRGGIITQQEYTEIDTIMTNKYGVSSCTIFH